MNRPHVLRTMGLLRTSFRVRVGVMRWEKAVGLLNDDRSSIDWIDSLNLNISYNEQPGYRLATLQTMCSLHRGRGDSGERQSIGTSDTIAYEGNNQPRASSPAIPATSARQL